MFSDFFIAINKFLSFFRYDDLLFSKGLIYEVFILRDFRA